MSDAYLYHDALAACVGSACIVLLSYDAHEQVLLGVLGDAIGAGKPVVSMRFPHAVELLSSGGTVADPEGIDVARLIALKDEGGSVHDCPTGQKLDRDAVIDVDCEIWLPAARPDVINATSQR